MATRPAASGNRPVMHRSRLRVAIGVIAALSVGPAFLVSRTSAETPLPIRIGYQPTAEWLLYTARELKFFEKEGLAPTYVKFVAGAPMIAAVESRSIDLAAPGFVPFLLGLSQGVDWVMIGLQEGAYASGIVAGRGSGINTPADLKGKRIGYLRGSSAHYGVTMVLRQHGIRLDQVTLLHLSPAEQLAALAKKEIDAAMVWEPWIQRMIHEANARIIATEGELGIYMNVGGYSVRRDWLRDNRETAVRFLRGLLMAYDILRRDERVAISAGAQEMEISEAWAETIYREVPPPNIYLWADPQYRYSLVKGAAVDRRLGYLATFLLEEKIIPKPVDLRGVLDASVIAEALKTRSQGR
jgi:ABC-type nitrate/sulfonate/bicarbonate transport system substrate-binding protein